MKKVGRGNGKRLTTKQRLAVLKLVAAEYSSVAILARLDRLNSSGERLREYDEPFPVLTESAVDYYRTRHKDELVRLKTERIEAAMIGGCASKAERIARLCAHADELESLKWDVSITGKLWNEKAWRETLADIALEMGERRPKDVAPAEQIIKVYFGFDPDQV